jgi:hypothetical protein
MHGAEPRRTATESNATANPCCIVLQVDGSTAQRGHTTNEAGMRLLSMLTGGVAAVAPSPKREAKAAGETAFAPVWSSPLAAAPPPPAAAAVRGPGGNNEDSLVWSLVELGGAPGVCAPLSLSASWS